MNSAEKVKLYLSQIRPSLVGKFFYYCLPFRRAIIEDNIKLILGGSLSPEEQVKFAQCVYGHFASFVKENILLRFLSQSAIQDRVELRDEEYFIQAMAEKRGALFLTGHFGNWEFAPVGAFLQLKILANNPKLHCIRKTFSHQFIDDAFFKPFCEAGIAVIPKDKGLRRALRTLKQGDGIIVVFDQHASPGNTGIETRFFDKPVGSYRSLAKLAKATQAPVIPTSYFRLASGKHVLQFHPEIPFISDPDPEKEQVLNTQAYNDFIEQTIVAHPEQWIWMHRRWKYFTKNKEMFSEHSQV